MDSKLKKLAILGSMAMILLVSVLVVLGNAGHGRGNGSSVTEEFSEESPGPQEPPENVLVGQVGDDLSAFLEEAICLLF